MDGKIHTLEDVRNNFNARPTDKYEAAAKRLEWDLVAEKLATQAKARSTNPDQPKNILDIGTGPGVSARILKNTFAENSVIIGVDPSDQPVEAIKRTGSDRVLDWAIIHPAAGLSETYDTDLREQCDLVTLVGVADLMEPEDLERTVPEFSALMSTGGVLAITVEPEGAQNPGVDSKQHNLETLTEILNKHGFTDVQTTQTSYKAWKSAKDRGQDIIDTTIVTAIKAENLSL